MSGEGRRFFIETFGCQMNVNDSEKVAGLLLAEGYRPARGISDADLVFVNTCAVREKAAEKLHHALGRLRRQRRRKPGLVVGVGGCVAQLEGARILERAPEVDLVVGPRNLARLPELLRRCREGGARPAVDLDRDADAFSVPPSRVAHSSPVRAYVTVVEGCNQVCSFCVVPRARGPEACRGPEGVVAEVGDLVGRGYPEVMLLGQTVNAYRHGETDFASLLERVGSVPGLRRLRFATSHPAHVSERLARAMRDVGSVCPYLHLPIQSGSDRVLSSMRRGYTRGRYLEVVAMVREAVPGIALSTDVITGYPGEDDDDFARTLEVLDRVRFDALFSFTYSPRPGTSAFRLGDPVPEVVKRRRLAEVNAAQQRAQQERNEARLGLVDEILVDTVVSPGRVSGRTPHFRIVHVDGCPDQLGRLLRVEVTGAGPNSLQGRVLER